MVVTIFPNTVTVSTLIPLHQFYRAPSLLPRTLAMGLVILCCFHVKSQDTLYTKYNHQTFFKLSIVNKPINLEAIDYRLLNAAVFHETNRQRHRHSKPPLKFSDPLLDAAMAHSQQMVKHKFLGHKNPHNKDLQQVKDRLKEAGWSSSSYGENVSDAFFIQYEGGKSLIKKQEEGKTVFYRPLLFGLLTKKVPIHTYQSFARALVDFWMSSPPHRKNILNPHYTHLGCGVASRNYTYPLNEIPRAKATQNFGHK